MITTYDIKNQNAQKIISNRIVFGEGKSEIIGEVWGAIMPSTNGVDWFGTVAIDIADRQTLHIGTTISNNEYDATEYVEHLMLHAHID